jgi:hypothetical protein
LYHLFPISNKNLQKSKCPWSVFYRPEFESHNKIIEWRPLWAYCTVVWHVERYQIL